jgi:hypothetical protein
VTSSPRTDRDGPELTPLLLAERPLLPAELLARPVNEVMTRTA